MTHLDAPGAPLYGLRPMREMYLPGTHNSMYAIRSHMYPGYLQHARVA